MIGWLVHDVVISRDIWFNQKKTLPECDIRIIFTWGIYCSVGDGMNEDLNGVETALFFISGGLQE